MVEQGTHKPLVGSPNLPLGTHYLHTLSSGFIWLNVRSVCIIIKGSKEMALDRFITLSEAAQRMRTSVKETRSMIKSGKIKGGLLPDGAMVVSEETLPTRNLPKKEDLKEYKRYAHLGGIKIGINEAAKKYGLNFSTLRRWVVSGYVKKVGQIGQKILVNEQDVAYCVWIYHRSGGQGKRLFNKDGTPYQSKTTTSSS